MASTVAISSSNDAKSETTCRTPRPHSPMAAAIPASSLVAAVRVGVHSPRDVRWLRVLEVLKPNAPASTASRVSRPIAAMSSSVASSRAAPRSPIT
jgi:hypothetical protein